MKIPRRTVRATAFGVAGICALGLAAEAEEITVRNIHQATDAKYAQPGDQEGHVAGYFERKGVSLMPDEENVAYSNFGWFDYVGPEGSYLGYGRYTFDDGSEIVERFEGNTTQTEDGDRSLTGSNELISGTGRFEGVSGSGTHACSRAAAHIEAGINIVDCTVTLDRTLP